ANVVRVHVARAEAVEQLVSQPIDADAADQVNLRSQPPGLHGLIGAFAAREHAETAAEQGLALLRQPLGRGDEIEHQAADHDDARFVLHGWLSCVVTGSHSGSAPRARKGLAPAVSLVSFRPTS